MERSLIIGYIDQSETTKGKSKRLTFHGSHEVTGLYVNRRGVQQKPIVGLVDLRISPLDSIQSGLCTQSLFRHYC